MPSIFVPTPVVIPLPLPTPVPQSGKRRGAQPHNTNARKHGYYSAPKPFSPQHNPASAVQRKIVVTPVPPLVPSAPFPWEDIIDRLDQQSGQCTNLHVQRFYNRAIISTINKKLSLLMHERKLTAGPRRLQSLSGNAAVLISFHKSRLFTSSPISPPLNPMDLGDTVPGLIGQVGRGFGESGAFLTDRHWHILQPLLENLHRDQAALLKRPSRAVPYPDRFLLDGIFWKLATASKWSALPTPYPLRRCQKLYRQLCQGGFLIPILNLLLEDLLAWGVTDLETLAASGKFILHRNRVLFKTQAPPTWQERIALLILQCNQKTVLRLQRRMIPPFSERRLPGYKPGMLRKPSLRLPYRRRPFVPPYINKKDALNGWHYLRIPEPRGYSLQDPVNSPGVAPRAGQYE